MLVFQIEKLAVSGYSAAPFSVRAHPAKRYLACVKAQALSLRTKPLGIDCASLVPVASLTFLSKLTCVYCTTENSSSGSRFALSDH